MLLNIAGWAGRLHNARRSRWILRDRDGRLGQWRPFEILKQGEQVDSPGEKKNIATIYVVEKSF